MMKKLLVGSMVSLLCFQITSAATNLPRENEPTEPATVLETDVLDPISGTVTDALTEEPIPGVNVLIKGTTSGTITDVAGKFNLEADSENTLVFSSVGYTTIEVAVGNNSVFNISLQEDVTALSEVVVVGYGTQEKRDVTAAIGSIDADQIKAIPVASSVEAM